MCRAAIPRTTKNGAQLTYWQLSAAERVGAVWLETTDPSTTG